MKKSFFILILFFISDPDIVLGQNKNEVSELRRLYTIASSDTDKIVALNSLANYYNSNRITKEGKAVLDEQLRVAHLSTNENLILKTYFDNTLANIPNWSSLEQFNTTLSFIQDGIDFAKNKNRYDYVAIGLARKAAVLRKSGKIDEAVAAAISTFNIMKEVTDSLKAIVYMELGNCYRDQEEWMTAASNYNTAYDLAIKNKNPTLEADINRYLGILYSNVKRGDRIEAKNFLMESYNLNKKYKNNEGLIKDYIELARLEGDTSYLAKALALATSHELRYYRVRAKEIWLAIYAYVLGDRQKALVYLESDAELKDFYLNGGEENYFYELAQLYLYSNKPDSALEYLKKAEPGLLENYDVARSLYRNIATCYEYLHDKANAIKYYEISFSHYRTKNELRWIGIVAGYLTRLYKETNNIEKAFFYSQVGSNVKDSILSQSPQKNNDLSLLAVNRDNIRHKEEQEKKEATAKEEINKQKLVRNFIAGVAGIIVLTSLLSFLFYKRKRDAEQKQKETSLSLQVSETEMKSLRSQMSPHFIFNALQSIQTFLLSHKSEEANAYLLKFSKLMRLVLENSQHSEVPLKEDMQALELYMQLESIRLQHPFTYQFHIDKNVDIENDNIPPLILQPFVENAIWHGLNYKPESGHIDIYITKRNNALYASVEDNGVGRDSTKKNVQHTLMKKQSLGMKLTEERLKILNETKNVKADFKVIDLFTKDNTPSGTKVELSLPLMA